MCENGYDFAERYISPKKEKISQKFNNLQRQDLEGKDLSVFKFTKTLYKTIDEILSEPNKSNCNKLQEWFDIEKEHNGLIDIKFDGGLGMMEARSKPGYNRTKEEELGGFCLEVLLLDKAIKEGKYKEINNL